MEHMGYMEHMEHVEQIENTELKYHSRAGRAAEADPLQEAGMR